jgi:hypothetical protein
MYVRFVGRWSEVDDELRWACDAEVPFRVGAFARGGYVVSHDYEWIVLPREQCEVVDSEEILFATLRDAEGFRARAARYGIHHEGVSDLAGCPRLFVLTIDRPNVIVYPPGGAMSWIIPGDEVDLS